MKSILKTSTVISVATLIFLMAGCGSEAPETSKLYTDAKELYDGINQAFTLPARSQQRVDKMNKIIDEKWDEQVIAKLEQYLKQAPSGKHAKEAKSLLEEARNSQNIRMLSQVRPFLKQVGAPRTAAEADTFSQQMQEKIDATRKDSVNDTTQGQ